MNKSISICRVLSQGYIIYSSYWILIHIKGKEYRYRSDQIFNCQTF